MQSRIFKTSNKFHSLLLWPADGALDPGKSGEPFIAAGIRWLHADTAIDDEARCPRVGVRVGPGRAELREAFLDSGQPPARATREEHGYRGDTPWPVYRYVRGDAAWWADLDAYRARVVREVETVVTLFGDNIRSAYPVTGSVA